MGLALAVVFLNRRHSTILGTDPDDSNATALTANVSLQQMFCYVGIQRSLNINQNHFQLVTTIDFRAKIALCPQAQLVLGVTNGKSFDVRHDKGNGLARQND